METALFDSSIWISYLSKLDIYAAKAERLINSILNYHEILLPDIVVIEIINVLKRKYQFQERELQEVLSFLINTKKLKLFHLNNYFLKETLIPVIIRSNLKSSDLQILACAIHKNIKYFYSFDKKLTKEFHHYRQNL